MTKPSLPWKISGSAPVQLLLAKIKIYLIHNVSIEIYRMNVWISVWTSILQVKKNVITVDPILKNVIRKERFLFKWYINFRRLCVYYEDEQLVKDRLRKRLDMVEFLKQTLRTFYPYGLNKHKRKSEKLWHYWQSEFSVKRYDQRIWKYRDGRNHRRSSNNVLQIFDIELFKH